MKTRVAAIAALMAICLVTSCTTFFRGVVGLEAAMDSAAKEYATMFNDGLIPPDVHEKASKTHGEYQKVAGVAHDALVAYKLSGDPTKFREAFVEAQKAALAFVNLIVPYLSREEGKTITANIQNASTL